MIDHKTFEMEHIKNIKANYPNLDQFIIERMIFAFGLLEALVKVDLPFVFKGGTSLILLLKQPYRLSTDIDIIVEQGINLDPYLMMLQKYILLFVRKIKCEKARMIL